MRVMEYYCAIRNDELMDLYKNGKDLQQIWTELSRTRRTLYTVTESLWDNEM